MKKWIIGVVVAALLVVVGGPFVYFHFIEGKAPPKLSIDTVTVPTTAAGATGRHEFDDGAARGTWKIGKRIHRAVPREGDAVRPERSTAVGTTNTVTGSLTIAGTQLTKAAFTVDMTTVKSDRSQRDDQFQGRIMDTSEFPTGTFTLTSPVELAPVRRTASRPTTPPRAS